jgi:hypothetical protein
MMEVTKTTPFGALPPLAEFGKDIASEAPHVVTRRTAMILSHRVNEQIH